MAISIFEEPNTHHGLVPRWANVLLKKYKVNEGWVQDLRFSVIARPGIPRAGVIIDVSTCQYLNMVHAMVYRDVPVWLFWGKRHALHKAQSYVDPGCIPTEQDIAASQDPFQRVTSTC